MREYRSLLLIIFSELNLSELNLNEIVVMLDAMNGNKSILQNQHDIVVMKKHH